MEVTASSSGVVVAGVGLRECGVLARADGGVVERTMQRRVEVGEGTRLLGAAGYVVGFAVNTRVIDGCSPSLTVVHCSRESRLQTHIHYRFTAKRR